MGVGGSDHYKDECKKEKKKTYTWCTKWNNTFTPIPQERFSLLLSLIPSAFIDISEPHCSLHLPACPLIIYCRQFRSLLWCLSHKYNILIATNPFVYWPYRTLVTGLLQASSIFIFHFPVYSLPKECLFQPIHWLWGGLQHPITWPHTDVSGCCHLVDAADGKEVPITSPPDPGSAIIPWHSPRYVLVMGCVGVYTVQISQVNHIAIMCRWVGRWACACMCLCWCVCMLMLVHLNLWCLNKCAYMCKNV